MSSQLQVLELNRSHGEAADRVNRIETLVVRTTDADSSVVRTVRLTTPFSHTEVEHELRKKWPYAEAKWGDTKITLEIVWLVRSKVGEVIKDWVSPQRGWLPQRGGRWAVAVEEDWADWLQRIITFLRGI